MASIESIAKSQEDLANSLTQSIENNSKLMKDLSGELAQIKGVMDVKEPKKPKSKKGEEKPEAEGSDAAPILKAISKDGSTFTQIKNAVKDVKVGELRKALKELEDKGELTTRKKGKTKKYFLPAAEAPPAEEPAPVETLPVEEKPVREEPPTPAEEPKEEPKAKKEEKKTKPKKEEKSKAKKDKKPEPKKKTEKKPPAKKPKAKKEKKAEPKKEPKKEAKTKKGKLTADDKNVLELIPDDGITMNKLKGTAKGIPYKELLKILKNLIDQNEVQIVTRGRWTLYTKNTEKEVN
jgi:hypothetical protein